MESGSGKFDLLRQKQMQLAVMHINLLDEPLHTADQLEAFRMASGSNSNQQPPVDEHQQRQQKAFNTIISKLEELAAEMSNVAATVGGLKSFEIDKLPAGDDLLSVEPSILLSPSPSSTLPAVLLQDVQEEKESAVQERATVLGSRLQSPPGGLLNSSLAQGYPRISLERFSSQGNLFATAARQNSQSGSLGNFLPSGANSTAEVAKSRTSTVRLAKASSSVDIGNSSVGLAAQSPAIGALNRERSRSRSVNDSARPAHQ